MSNSRLLLTALFFIVTLLIANPSCTNATGLLYVKYWATTFPVTQSQQNLLQTSIASAALVDSSQVRMVQLPTAEVAIFGFQIVGSSSSSSSSSSTCAVSSSVEKSLVGQTVQLQDGSRSVVINDLSLTLPRNVEVVSAAGTSASDQVQNLFASAPSLIAIAVVVLLLGLIGVVALGAYVIRHSRRCRSVMSCCSSAKSISEKKKSFRKKMLSTKNNRNDSHRNKNHQGEEDDDDDSNGFRSDSSSDEKNNKTFDNDDGFNNNQQNSSITPTSSNCSTQPSPSSPKIQHQLGLFGTSNNNSNKTNSGVVSAAKKLHQEALMNSKWFSSSTPLVFHHQQQQKQQNNNNNKPPVLLLRDDAVGNSAPFGSLLQLIEMVGLSSSASTRLLEHLKQQRMMNHTGGGGGGILTSLNGMMKENPLLFDGGDASSNFHKNIDLLSTLTTSTLKELIRSLDFSRDDNRALTQMFSLATACHAWKLSVPPVPRLATSNHNQNSDDDDNSEYVNVQKTKTQKKSTSSSSRGVTSPYGEESDEEDEYVPDEEAIEYRKQLKNMTDGEKRDKLRHDALRNLARVRSKSKGKGCCEKVCGICC